MKIATSAVFAATLLALSAGAASAQTFNVAAMPDAEARKTIEIVVRLGIAAQNCRPFSISDADAAKLNNFADALQAKLKLNADQFEKQIETPAFNANERDNAGFCKTYTPQVNAFLKRIP